MSDSMSDKKAYTTPDVVELGRVADRTKGGASFSAKELWTGLPKKAE